MLINLSVQIGKLRHDAGRPVPCHTRSFTHRAKEKPPSWVRNLVPSIARSIAAHCWGLRDTSRRGTSLFGPFCSFPWQSPPDFGKEGSLVRCTFSLAQPLRNPQRYPHHTGAHHTTPTPPSLPDKRGCWGHTSLHGRRRQSHNSQPAERTRYKLLKSR